MLSVVMCGDVEAKHVMEFDETLITSAVWECSDFFFKIEFFDSSRQHKHGGLQRAGKVCSKYKVYSD